MSVMLKLAYRNLTGAKLRTGLNVAVISMVFVIAVAHMAIFNGMNAQAVKSVVEQQAGGGQYWYKGYNPEDPLSEGPIAGPVPDALAKLIESGQATAVLVDNEATIYPGGRLLPVAIRGIDPKQDILELPTEALAEGEQDDDVVPVLIGRLMASSKALQEGDTFLIRWRDANGVFDAIEGRVAKVMNTTVPAIDQGQIWVPLDRLRSMRSVGQQASYVVVSASSPHPSVPEWNFKSREYLLGDIQAAVNQKRAGSIVMYMILMTMILLAIFDAQVLSIFRRRKEIGTLMALGFTRRQVVFLFTLEGTLNGVLALGVSLIYGIPLWIAGAMKGLPMGDIAKESGLPIPEHIYPEYSITLVLVTAVIIVGAVAAVSYWPSRRIARLSPTQALRGHT